MGIFFDIIRFSASSIFWGILFSALLMGLFVFIVRGWWKDALFTPVTYAIGAVLALLLAFQCTLMVGAIKIKNNCEDYKVQITELTDQYFPNKDKIMSDEDSQALFSRIIEEHPLVGHYLGAITESEDGINGWGHIWIENGTVAEQATALTDYLKELMNEYILRRVLWSLGFVIVLGVIAIKTMETRTTSSRKGSRSDGRIRRDTQRIQRDTRRISRRR